MAIYTKQLGELSPITTLDVNNDKVAIIDANDNNTPKLSTLANLSNQLPLTNLNASNLASGTIPDARFPLTLPALNGANLSALSASALAAGTVPDARFPATLPAVSGAQLTNLNANNLSAGTIPDARFPAILPALNGSNLTTLNGSQITTGTVAEARISSDIARKNKTTFSIGTGTYGLLAADSDKVILPAGGGAVTVEVSANVVAGNQFTIVNFIYKVSSIHCI